jgi:hypothetical protein
MIIGLALLAGVHHATAQEARYFRISLGSPIRATNITMTASETSTNSKAFYRIAQLP